MTTNLEKINYAGPSITSKEMQYVQDAVANGFYQNYREHVRRLESAIVDLLGVKFALATNSCTAALHLALIAAGIKAGDEVITTDCSCVASAMPILYCGATPVLVDVDERSWTMSPSAVRSAITSRTKAIVAVHWNGHPCDMVELQKIAAEYSLTLIEDGAPALGATVGEVPVGSIGKFAAFSFQGAKIAIGGQGGVLVSNCAEGMKLARSYASYGRTDSVMQYWSDFVGFNYGMPNLPAALALAQVERLPELLAKKQELFAVYQQELSKCEEVRLVLPLQNTKSTFCYPAMLLTERSRVTRQELLDRLAADNIDARPAQPRISGMPMFERRFDNKNGALVEARGVILPSAFNLSNDQIKFVCDRIKDVVGHA